MPQAQRVFSCLWHQLHSTSFWLAKEPVNWVSHRAISLSATSLSAAARPIKPEPVQRRFQYGLSIAITKAYLLSVKQRINSEV